MDGSRRRFVVNSRARGHHDANRLHDTLKDAGVDGGSVTFGGAVNDPDVVAGAAEIVAHFFEARSVEESGDGDEANDAFAST